MYIYDTMVSRQSALLFLFAASALIIALIATNQNGLVQANDQSNSVARSGFKFSKLFSFSSFKKLFKKNYNSPSEQSNREKIFLGNTFRSFISKISYKHETSPMYLSVNEMSDWTDEEFDRTLMNPKVYYEDIGIDQEDKKKTSLGSLFQDGDLEKSDGDLDVESIDYKKIEEALRGLDIGQITVDKQVDSSGSNKFSEIKSYFHKLKHSKLNLGQKLRSFGKMLANVPNRAMNNVEGSVVRGIFKMPQRRTDLPDEVFVDHTRSGCLTWAKSQRNCGSCYIFSTMALYEWAYCRLNGKQVIFSEQYVVDCGHRMRLKGCGGGEEHWVASFTKKYGFELMTDIDYLAKETMCPYDKIKEKKGQDNVNATKTQFEQLDLPSEVGEDAMGKFKMDSPKLVDLWGPSNIEKQLKISPVIIALRTSNNFRHYGGGVDLGEGCERRFYLHSMLIVGSGRQDGYEYWLVRNSWGLSWGDWGYGKVAKNSNCYTLMHMGLTIKALHYKKAPELISNSTIPLIKLESQSDRNVLVYNFTENPKHNPTFLFYSLARIRSQAQ